MGFGRIGWPTGGGSGSNALRGNGRATIGIESHRIGRYRGPRRGHIECTGRKRNARSSGISRSVISPTIKGIARTGRGAWGRKSRGIYFGSRVGSTAAVIRDMNELTKPSVTGGPPALRPIAIMISIDVGTRDLPDIA